MTGLAGSTDTDGSLQQFTRSQSVLALSKEQVGTTIKRANSLVSFHTATRRVSTGEIDESEISSVFDFSQERISQSEQSVETVKSWSTVSGEQLNSLSSQSEDSNNQALATASTDNTCRDGAVFTVTTQKALSVHTCDMMVDTSIKSRDTSGNQENKYSQQHEEEDEVCAEVTQENEPLSTVSSMPAYPKYTDTWSSEYSSGYDTMHSNQNRKFHNKTKVPKSYLCSSNQSPPCFKQSDIHTLEERSSRKSFPYNFLSRSASQSQTQLPSPDEIDNQSCSSPTYSPPLLETLSLSFNTQPAALPLLEHNDHARTKKKPESVQDVLQSDDEGFFSLNTRLQCLAYQTSFSGLILDQASKDMPAQLYMIAMDEYKTGQQDYLTVRQGQEFRVLFQEEEEVFAITRDGQSGYIPLSLCHLSSKYLSEPNKQDIVYSRYSCSPNMPKGKPIMYGIATVNFQASSPTELSVSAGERLSILLENNTWVYAVSSNKAGFVPRQVLRQQESEADGSQSFPLSRDPFSYSFPEISSNTNADTSYNCYNFFSKEVLCKASPQIPANLHMVCIRDYKASRFDEVDVKTGQYLACLALRGI